jgi:hypothetical protein
MRVRKINKLTGVGGPFGFKEQEVVVSIETPFT